MKSYLWYSVFTNPVGHYPSIVDWLVPKATDVEAQTPVWWQKWSTNHSSEFPKYVIRGGASKDVEVKDTADSAPSESGGWLQSHLCIQNGLMMTLLNVLKSLNLGLNPSGFVVPFLRVTF